MMRAIILLIALVLVCGCGSDAQPSARPSVAAVAAAPVQRGMVLPTWQQHGYPTSETDKALAGIVAVGANWVQIVPTWYQAARSSAVITSTASTVDDDNVRRVATLARAHGLKVMLKPHVDVMDGSDRGVIAPDDRDAWFASYREFVTHYADLAAQLGVHQFAVGTELRGVSADRTQWLRVIAEVRKVFRGELVYAANHDEYQSVAFWDAVDLVGIDAYWSLSTSPTADVAPLRRALATRRDELAAFAADVGRRILFTEAGFPSQHGAATAPWDGTISRRQAQDEQAAAYEAFLDVFTREAWCAGIFFWTWTVSPRRDGDPTAALDTSVRGKAAQLVVEKWWTPSLGARAAAETGQR